MSWLCCFWAVTSTKNFKSFNLTIQKSTIGRFSKYSKINVSIFWIFWNFFQNFWNFFEYIRKIENHESVLYDEFGVDCDLIDKLFYFFNRQSLLLAGKQDIKLYSILAGIILFAPDRGLSKLSYRKSEVGSDSGQKVSLGVKLYKNTIQNRDSRANRQFQITIISTWYKVYKTNVLIFYKDMSKDIARLRKVYWER